MKEIERKFLVDKSKLSFLTNLNGVEIKQAYIQNESNRSVRLRVKGEKAFITIKIGSDSLSRDEFEYQIPVFDAEEMMKIMDLKILEKKRYEVKIKNHIWEIDVFGGKLSDLIVAEIELKSENESFDLPEWIGDEVTHNPFYLNANLINQL